MTVDEVRGETTRGPLADVKLHLIESIDEAWAFKRWLGERRERDVIAFDTESTGLSQERDHVRMVQFGDLHHGWAMASSDWLGIAKEVFRTYEGRLVGHNTPFDYGMLTSAGVKIRISQLDDTLPMAHVLEPNTAMSLKQQCARHVDRVAAYGQEQLDNFIKSGGWTWATVPIDLPQYWQYAALDPVLTAHLETVHRPVVDRECPEAYQLENAVRWVLFRAERYGAHVDVPYARERHDAFLDYCSQVERWCRDAYGIRPGSNAAVIETLEREGFGFTKMTDGGAKALDRDVLEIIRHPLAEAVLGRRRLQKLASTYLRHFIDECDADHLIHPSINSLGARTSRMSMSNPNLQNLPRKNASNPAADTIRNCITTRWDGGTMLMCDFDQIEMRLMAHLANDENMIRAFTDEGDFFVNVAKQMFDEPNFVKSDPRRQVVKNAGYANIYGAGIPKFALTAGISQAQAGQVMSRFHQLYPGVRPFQRDVDRQAMETLATTGRATVRSPLTGRFHVGDRGKFYALVNYLIQGTGAEILKMKIVEADAAGLGEWFVVPVHDELVLDVPGEHVRDAVHTLRTVMNDSRLLRVPVTASVSHGERWGSKREWSDDDE